MKMQTPARGQRAAVVLLLLLLLVVVLVVLVLVLVAATAGRVSYSCLHHHLKTRFCTPRTPHPLSKATPTRIPPPTATTWQHLCGSKTISTGIT